MSSRKEGVIWIIVWVTCLAGTISIALAAMAIAFKQISTTTALKEELQEFKVKLAELINATQSLNVSKADVHRVLNEHNKATVTDTANTKCLDRNTTRQSESGRHEYWNSPSEYQMVIEHIQTSFVGSLGHDASLDISCLFAFRVSRLLIAHRSSEDVLKMLGLLPLILISSESCI